MNKQAVSAALAEQFPVNPKSFETERFTVALLDPPKARELLGVLLQDELLAAELPWLEEKTRDGALKEAFLFELEYNAGAVKAWGIIERTQGTFVGAVIARNNVEGIDLEVLCASQFWNQGVADEAGTPVAEWLEDNIEFDLVTRQ